MTGPLVNIFEIILHTFLLKTAMYNVDSDLELKVKKGTIITHWKC